MSTQENETPRLDFSQWKRETLEDFANECYARVLELEKDVRTSIDAYRELVVKGSQDGKQ